MAAKDDIEQVVVLMLENRSFDHMLGHLTLPEEMGGRGRGDVEGLRSKEEDYNEHEGERFSIHRLKDTAAVDLDPPHHHHRVMRQIAPDDEKTATMGGFVQEYAKDIEDQEDPGDHPKASAPNGKGLMMGYYSWWEVWALSQMAQEFTVCDHWFSSLAGPTQPNRMYALAGTANEKTENQVGGLGTSFWDVAPVFEYLPKSLEARSFSHDISFLRMIDGKLIGTEYIDKVCRFFNRAQSGKIPEFSWIDPNFNMGIAEPLEEAAELQSWFNKHYQSLFGEREGGCDFDLDTDNSDHPDADIGRGQELVARVYNHLLQADPNLEKTLFIITYDEHGGFYDHVKPPGWQGAPGYGGSYLEDDQLDPVGVRVPAVAISGRLPRGGVCNTPMDHTALVRMILEKYAPDRLGEAPQRVQNAPSLWEELPWQSEARTDIEPIRKASMKRKNALREEMGVLATEALKEGGNYGNL